MATRVAFTAHVLLQLTCRANALHQKRCHAGQLRARHGYGFPLRRITFDVMITDDKRLFNRQRVVHLFASPVVWFFDSTGFDSAEFC